MYHLRMANRHFRVRLVVEGQAADPDPFRDPAALDISSPTHELAIRDYFVARTKFRRDMTIQKIPSECTMEITERIAVTDGNLTQTLAVSTTHRVFIPFDC